MAEQETAEETPCYMCYFSKYAYHKLDGSMFIKCYLNLETPVVRPCKHTCPEWYHGMIAFWNEPTVSYVRAKDWKKAEMTPQQKQIIARYQPKTEERGID